ncbi:flagellar hook-basal body complex protein FliE [Desulfogranum mediterraneum]|uniref:flagellar hook-basal body complex protein FliE n=1 Tax=Desulfogranum mediterraneum TaxID=160661 RepID=UPI00041603E9|nr:flagellar hook-basal body complex protein FliE [Desulfogranum mediterraneum]
MLPLQNIPPIALTPVKNEASEVANLSDSFQEILSNMVEGVSGEQQQADQAIQELHAGGEKNLHEAMISMEQADVSLRYMVQVRNKALEAYQEIMRMQV